MSLSSLRKQVEPCTHCGRGGLPIDNVWVAVDLDNTLIQAGCFPDYGPAMPGAIEGMTLLRAMGFKLMIWTNRTGLTDITGRYQNVNKVLDEIKDHLNKVRIPFDYVIPSMHKPSFIYKMVDDRAIQFEGDHIGGKPAWDRVVGTIVSDLAKRGIPAYGDKSQHLPELIF